MYYIPGAAAGIMDPFTLDGDKTINVTISRVLRIDANANISPNNAYANETITCYGNSSSSDLGDIVSWEWDFGDGTSGSGATVTHSYAGTGIYTVTLTVTDSEDNTDADSEQVAINDANGGNVNIGVE